MKIKVSRTDVIWRKLSSHCKPSSDCKPASMEVDKAALPAVIASKTIRELSKIDQKTVRRVFTSFDKLKRGKLDRRRFRLALEKLEIKLNNRDFRILAKSEVKKDFFGSRKFNFQLFEKDGETILIEKLLSKTAALHLISCNNSQ